MKKIATCLIIVLSLQACTLGNANGYVPTNAEIEQIQAGTDTKETVQQKFGRPAIIGEDQNTWYYVSQYRAARGPLPLDEVERRGLTIKFNSKGVVSGVKRFGLDDARNVPIANDSTKSGGRELSFWEQLVGSVGNYSAESFLND